MDEIWKQVGENCQVSSMGNIRKLINERWHDAKPTTNPKGYRFTSVKDFGKLTCRTKAVHRLVVEAFSMEHKGEVTRHLNGDPSDNRLVNLKWGTHKENALDRIRHGRASPGRPKKTGEKIDQIVSLSMTERELNAFNEDCIRMNISRSELFRIMYSLWKG